MKYFSKENWGTAITTIILQETKYLWFKAEL